MGKAYELADPDVDGPRLDALRRRLWDRLRRIDGGSISVRSELGRTYPLVIGGEKISQGETGDSVNPTLHC